VLVDDRGTSWPRAESAFVASISSGELAVIELSATDWARCAELITTYADLRLGLVDASVIAVAERLSVTTIATLNHRDFAVVRPAHCPAFELIP
jgi:predicted nucleic acid-binding protein